MDGQLIVIQSKIYGIRGQKVMLDFDLAEMYGTETKRLKESVKRNMASCLNSLKKSLRV